MSKKFLIFGDSITCGAWDSEGGWADRLKRDVYGKVIKSKGKLDFIVYNLGISGDVSESLIKRFEFETKNRLHENEERIFIFAIGINDSIFIKGKNNPIVSPDKFRANINKLIQLSLEFSARSVFIGLTPVDESKTNSIPMEQNGKCYKNEYIKKYDNIIKSVCADSKIDFVEIYGEFASRGCKKLLFDGLHPNSKGHQLMFEIVKNYLEKVG